LTYKFPAFATSKLFSLRSVVGNISYKRAILFHPPAHMISKEPQNVAFVLFFMRLCRSTH